MEYRVLALHYRFQSEVEMDKFDSAAPLSGTLGSFNFSLTTGDLKAEPITEFLDRESAKDAFEPYLRDWEQLAYLGSPGHRIRFDYQRSDLEEINPQPGFKFAFAEEAIGVGSANAAAVITRSNPAYPAPDPDFRRTPLTDLLTERLRRARDRQTELTSAAYFVLSRLEGEFGGRESLANALAVDRAVLKEFGKVSSRADPDLGRKGKGDQTPLTSAEISWIQATMIRLIRRVGEYAAGASIRRISLADLPPLP